MEIGGIDIVLPFRLAPHQVVTAVRNFWPALIVEQVGDEDGPDDIFIYRDKAAKALWDVDCPADEDDDMIYVLFGEKEMTLVIGSDGRNQPIADAMAALNPGVSS